MRSLVTYRPSPVNIDRWFDSLFQDWNRPATAAPRVDVREQADGYHLEAELGVMEPGDDQKDHDDGRERLGEPRLGGRVIGPGIRRQRTHEPERERHQSDGGYPLGPEMFGPLLGRAETPDSAEWRAPDHPSAANEA